MTGTQVTLEIAYIREKLTDPDSLRKNAMSTDPHQPREKLKGRRGGMQNPLGPATSSSKLSQPRAARKTRNSSGTPQALPARHTSESLDFSNSL